MQDCLPALSTGNKQHKGETMQPLVTELSEIVEAYLHKEARERNLATVSAYVTKQLRHPTMFHVERRDLGLPSIRVSYTSALRLLDDSTHDTFRRHALVALRFATRMARVSPLVTSDTAYEYNARRREWRRTPIFAGTASLPDRYFRTDTTITVRCELSGRTLTANVPHPTMYDATLNNLRNQLSRLLLIERENEIDLIESARETSDPNAIERVHITESDSGESHTRIYYTPFQRPDQRRTDA